MIITHAERQLKALLALWLVLFAGGLIVIGVLPWLPAGRQLSTQHPLITMTWVGQAFLFLCAFYWFHGIRDNALSASVIVTYQFTSGTAMMLSLLKGSHTPGGLLQVVGGGVLAFAVGGLTLICWFQARQSQSLRMPPASDVETGTGEELTGPRAKATRLSLAISATIFGLTALAFFIALLFVSPRQNAISGIVAGNTVAVYATLAVLGILAAKAPRRRFYLLDIFVGVSLLTPLVLIFWTIRFHPPLSDLFRVGAFVHLIIAGGIFFLNRSVVRYERPSKFWGAWLHGAFEKFSEVIIKGGIEVMTPREIADAADALLAETPSRRVSSVKGAMIFIELGALFKFRLPMSRMGRLEREGYLSAVFARGSGLFRDMIRIKQLVFLIYYSDKRVYKELGFPLFQEREKYQEARANDKLPTGDVIYPASVTGAELVTDICVIGSGAGGAVVAARLAEANKRVVILEEGPFLKRDQITDDEGLMQNKAYREGGLQLTVDFDMYVLQGRCVGGSTFVNNGIVFDLPESVYREWQNLGISLNRDRLNDAFIRVRDEIEVIKLAKHQHLVEKGSLKFVEGCRSLGLPADWFDVNLDGCFGCGYCTLGCRYEKKMSVDRSYIPRALKAGAILVSDCKAMKITAQGSRAKTVKCRRADGSPFTVKANQIVVACGAIASSLLLQRSGIRRNVGTRLSFNVASWVFAEFPQLIDAYDGVQMCAYHKGDRSFLETIALPPGAFAAAMPGWFREHFDRMHRYRYYAAAGALIATAPTGRVKAPGVSVLKNFVSPVHFKLSIANLHRLKEGIEQVCRIYLAAGAMRVIPATFYPLEFVHPTQLDRIDEYVLEPDDLSFGSAHPQGGNPMSEDRKVGVVDSHFRVHGFENLYVCDASIFPSSVEVNPQLTIMAMADYASGVILDS